MRTIHDVEHVFLAIDDVRRIVVFRRKATRLHADDVAGVFAAIAAQGSTIDRSAYGLLIDSRAAPFNNDDAFEAAMRGYIAAHTAGFRRRAVLVRTAVGVLQVARTSRALEEHGGPPQAVFRDEAEALAYLSAP